ncbi:MAG: hypothetical protein GY801_33350, partial [bacterium]|nr:hypothetical protein [bacterium]
VDGVRTYFFYSDEGLIAEYDVSGTELRSYGYKSDSTWSTDPLWLKTGGQYYFYQNDHLGTPQKLTAQNGMVVWQAKYSAFGEATIDTEHITNHLRFPGQYEDAETGLHYNFQRYYDPGIGRYVSVDPAGFNGGLNLFAYVFNNPGKYSDPRGLGIHPQHVVPADETYRVVLDVTTGGYRPKRGEPKMVQRGLSARLILKTTKTIPISTASIIRFLLDVLKVLLL